VRRVGKWFFTALGSLVVLLAIGITSTIGWSPFLGPKARALTNRTFERTQQRLERGRYIVTGLSGCVYCHSPHDWTAPGMPIIAGKEASGEVLPYAGLPGRIVAQNLTPIRKPERAVGLMINWPALYAKASATMAAPFFPLCRTNTTAICRMRTWHPLWSTCGPCLLSTTSFRPPKSFSP
jgi:hypothetical protein